MLILRNRVFRLLNVEIWLVLSWYVVDLMILRNSVINPATRSDMECNGLLRGLFADCEEWHFQAENPSDKSSTFLLLGRFGEAQE